MSPRRRPTKRRPRPTRRSKRLSKAEMLKRFKGGPAPFRKTRRKPKAAEPKMTPADRKAKAREARLAALKARPKKKTRRGSADTKNIVSTAGPRPRPKPSVTTRMTPAERKAKARVERRKALKERPKKKTRLERAELGKKLVSKPGPRPSDPKKKKQSSIAKAEAAGMASRKDDMKKRPHLYAKRYR